METIAIAIHFPQCFGKQRTALKTISKAGKTRVKPKRSGIPILLKKTGFILKIAMMIANKINTRKMVSSAGLIF
ncbi:MAG: hypothetical protein K8R77_14640 [Anaerolineaceae bacterium]|nr:hypothetical protein [Anaerolineaceae bacterium]